MPAKVSHHKGFNFFFISNEFDFECTKEKTVVVEKKLQCKMEGRKEGGGKWGGKERERIFFFFCLGFCVGGCVAVDYSIFGGLVGWLFFLSGTFFCREITNAIDDELLVSVLLYTI